MGGIDWDSVDATAEALYRAAGAAPEDAAPPLRLAKALGLKVAAAHGASLPGLAALCRVNGEWRIYLRARLDDRREGWAIAHELGEWALARSGYREPDRELLANAIAAALIAPRQHFLRALRNAGAEIKALSRVLGSTESLAALRLGEVTGSPLALVTPRSVRVRGDEWAWPRSEPEMRRLAERGGPGLRRTLLADEPQRIALLVG